MRVDAPCVDRNFPIALRAFKSVLKIGTTIIDIKGSLTLKYSFLNFYCYFYSLWQLRTIHDLIYNLIKFALYISKIIIYKMFFTFVGCLIACYYVLKIAIRKLCKPKFTGKTVWITDGCSGLGEYLAY
jgi:hypothetical protein